MSLSSVSAVRLLREAHGVAHGAAERDRELLRDALRDRPRREPTRLRVGDRPADPAPELEADLRELRRLARARLPRHDDDLVVPDRLQELLASCGDRQLLGVGERRDRQLPLRHARVRLLELREERRELVLPRARVLEGAQALQAAAEPVLVAEGERAQAPPQLGDVDSGGHPPRLEPRPPRARAHVESSLHPRMRDEPTTRGGPAGAQKRVTAPMPSTAASCGDGAGRTTSAACS